MCSIPVWYAKLAGHIGKHEREINVSVNILPRFADVLLKLACEAIFFTKGTRKGRK